MSSGAVAGARAFYDREFYVGQSIKPSIGRGRLIDGFVKGSAGSRRPSVPASRRPVAQAVFDLRIEV